MKFIHLLVVLGLLFLISCQPAPRGEVIDVTDSETFVDEVEDEIEEIGETMEEAPEKSVSKPVPFKEDTSPEPQENLPTDVVLHLDMEETSQPGLFGVRSVKGKYGNGWAFSGDDYVQTDVDLRQFEAFTIGLWFRVDDRDQQSIMLWQGAPGGDGWGDIFKSPEMHLSFGEIRSSTRFVDRIHFFMGSQPTSVRSLRVQRPVKDENWHHITLIVENKTNTYEARLYLDGQNLVQDRDDGYKNQILISEMTEKVRLGKPDADTRYFVGEMDDLWIWNRALSDGEIEALIK